MSCSIGITPNKLLAKLASELQKPDGLTVLSYADLPTRIWPLPARSINGIGPKANAKLATLGIHTVGDLAHTDPAIVVARFGLHYGTWLTDAAHGRDERLVVTRREPKSISRETTFEHDLHPKRDRRPCPISCWGCASASVAISAVRITSGRPSVSNSAMMISGQ